MMKRVNEQITEEDVFLMFILKISKKIEISTLPSSVERPLNKIIYFPLMPQTFFLENKTKSDFFQTVDLENGRSDFMRRFPEYFIEMKHNYNLSVTRPFIYAIANNDTFHTLKNLCYYFGLLLNLFILFWYQLSEGEEKRLNSRRLMAIDWGEKLHNILSAIFAGFSFLFFLIWLFFKSYAEYKKVIPVYLYKNPGLTLPLKFRDKFSIAFGWVFYNATAPTNFLIHGIFAILAIFLSPLFTGFHVLLIFNISQTAQYLARSATAHARQLFLTLLLIIFTIWAYSLIYADRYSGQFDLEDSKGEKIDACQNMWRCLIFNLNFGLRNGGGLADSHKAYAFGGVGNGAMNVFQNSDWREGGAAVGKMALDVTFFIIINVLYLNIVQGIIIDTFGEMREEIDKRSKFTAF